MKKFAAKEFSINVNECFTKGAPARTCRLGYSFAGGQKRTSPVNTLHQRRQLRQSGWRIWSTLQGSSFSTIEITASIELGLRTYQLTGSAGDCKTRTE